MSRQGVRQAVAAYVNPNSVPGLATMYTAFPRDMLGENFTNTLIPGTMTGCSAFPFISTSHDQRIGFGLKKEQYEVTIQFAFASQQPEGTDAQDDVDAILDAVVTLIRADPTLGTEGSTTGPIFQAGEGDQLGAADIVVRQELPVVVPDGGTIVIWATVELTVLQLPIVAY